jgi:hypothetical protein
VKHSIEDLINGLRKADTSENVPEETFSRGTSSKSSTLAVKPLDPWYVTGFTDGDGCFTYSWQDKAKTKIALYFAIKLNTCDESLLEAFKEYFGGGRIYDVKAREKRHNSGLTKRSKYFRISSIPELHTVVGHFDQYPPRGHRLATYRVWKELYFLVSDLYGQRKKVPRQKLQHLTNKLSNLSPRNQPWAPPLL